MSSWHLLFYPGNIFLNQGARQISRRLSSLTNKFMSAHCNEDSFKDSQIDFSTIHVLPGKLWSSKQIKLQIRHPTIKSITSICLLFKDWLQRRCTEHLWTNITDQRIYILGQSQDGVHSYFSCQRPGMTSSSRSPSAVGHRSQTVKAALPAKAGANSAAKITLN